MNANEKIYVKSFDCSTVEDDWNKGEIGGTRSFWTGKDLSFGDPAFDSIEDALKEVCRANCFKYRKECWISFGRDCGEDFGRFDGDFIVDADNNEASPAEIDEWKAGAKRLYACHVTVALGVRSVRELTESEANEF